MIIPRRSLVLACHGRRRDLFKATVATSFGKQPIQVWAGPRSGPQIAQQSEKAKRRQIGARFHLPAPGFFAAQTALCRDKARLAEIVCHRTQAGSPAKVLCTAFFQESASPLALPLHSIANPVSGGTDL